MVQVFDVMGAEAQREGEWANRYAETLKTNQSNAFAQIGFSSLQSLLDTLSNVAVIYLGARAVMDGSITVGLLFAFLSYKSQFMDRAQGL